MVTSYLVSCPSSRVCTPQSSTKQFKTPPFILPGQFSKPTRIVYPPKSSPSEQRVFLPPSPPAPNIPPPQPPPLPTTMSPAMQALQSNPVSDIHSSESFLGSNPDAEYAFYDDLGLQPPSIPEIIWDISSSPSSIPPFDVLLHNIFSAVHLQRTTTGPYFHCML